MKKILLTIVISATTILSGVAQISSNSGFGLRLLWDYTVPATNIKGINSGSGVSAGAIYDIPLSHNIYFEPGLSLFYDTMDLDFFDLYFNGREAGPNGTIRNLGFRIPMIFGYKIALVDNIAVSIIAGPQLNVGLANKVHYQDKNVKDINLYDDGWHRNDLQIVFGVKLHYLDNFFAEIMGNVGLTNQVDTDVYPRMHARRNIVNLGVGYKF